MRCQNVCCQKALGQVDKHGRNRRRGLYVKVSLYLHETRLCCYKTARVPTVAETFGQHPRIIWATIWATPSNNLGNNLGNTLEKFGQQCGQHPRTKMGNNFGNTPFCFWQHPLPLLGQHLSAELLALIPVVHGGYYSKGFLVALIPLLPWWLKEAR